MLRLAVQKSGRLSEPSVSILRECGIELPPLKSGGSLKCTSSTFPVEVYFLRDDDIPLLVANGTVDAAIIGENLVVEQRVDCEIVERLGFGKCRLSIAIPKSSAKKSEALQTCTDERVKLLSGLTIATSYPNTLADFLDKSKIAAEIHNITGSAEIAPSLGLSDAICDLVSSGSTLISNGLVELLTVLQSEAVLISSLSSQSSRHHVSSTEHQEKVDALQKLLFRIRAVKKARSFKYIMLNAPNSKLEEIFALLPGVKSPSVLPLANSDWSSVHSVCEESKYWDLVESLTAAGAQGILVLQIEKMFS